MRRISDSSIACALLGVAFLACSSDDSTPAANPADSSVGANQPQGMSGSGGQAGSTGTTTAAPAGNGGSAGAPEGSAGAPASEGPPSDVGLAGAGNPDNGAGNTPDSNTPDSNTPENSGGDAPDAGSDDTPAPTAMLGVFVATASDSGGDLGGLAGADATCQALAASVGAGGRTWRAYLSTSTIDARDRIGDGPWVNANGLVVATDLTDLHTLTAARGTPLVDLFVDQEGNRINGQWAGSPAPNQHDALTGSAADGTRLAATCNDWTSATATPGPQVGHTDGLGPGMNGTGNFGSWNSSHAPQGCSQQQLIQVGGAGRFYCFAAD